MCHVQQQLCETALPLRFFYPFTVHILEQLLGSATSTHRIKPLTFSQAVADTGIPGQQGLSAVKAKDQHVGEAEYGEGVGYAIIPWTRLYTTDALRVQRYIYFKNTSALESSISPD